MTRSHAVGLILAGGRGSRLGGVDKAFVGLAGEPLIAHVIQRLRPQVGTLLINANGDPQRFSSLGLRVVSDENPASNSGPLAGILAGMRGARVLGSSPKWIVSVPCDTPFVPVDLVTKLTGGEDDPAIVRAASGGRVHHLVAAWRLSLHRDLQRALADGTRKVADWAETCEPRVATVTFPTEPFDPFLNINRPEDLRQAELILSSQREHAYRDHSG